MVFNFSILPFDCFYFIVVGGGMLYFDVYIDYLGICTFYTFKQLTMPFHLQQFLCVLLSDRWFFMLEYIICISSLFIAFISSVLLQVLYVPSSFAFMSSSISSCLLFISITSQNGFYFLGHIIAWISYFYQVLSFLIYFLVFHHFSVFIIFINLVLEFFNLCYYTWFFTLFY